MKRRREGEAPPDWKRFETIMKVQLGQLSVSQAAKELGITRQHYYRLEEQVLAAGLDATKRKKPGRQKPKVDPKVKELTDQVEKLQRERDILDMRVKDLEEIQQEMIARDIGVKPNRGKKSKRPRRRRARPPLPGSVPPDEPLPGGQAPSGGQDDGPDPQEPGPEPGDLLSMET
jgi:hypothetical protein